MEAKLRSGVPRGDVRVAPLSGWKTERERRRETCSRAASSDSNERMLGRGLRLLRGCGGWWRGWRSGGDLDRDGWGDGGDGFPFRRVRVDDWLRGFGGADEFDLVLEEGVAADEGWAAGFAEAEGRRDEECGFRAGFEETDAFLEPEWEGADGFAGGGSFRGFFEFGAVEECAADGDGDDIAFLGLGAVAGFLDDVLETGFGGGDAGVGDVFGEEGGGGVGGGLEVFGAFGEGLGLEVVLDGFHDRLEIGGGEFGEPVFHDIGEAFGDFGGVEVETEFAELGAHLSAGGVVEGLLAIEDIVEPAEDFFDVGFGERAACGFLFGAGGEVIAEGVAAAFLVGGEVAWGGIGGGRGGWGSGRGGGVLSGGGEEEGEGGEEEEERLHGGGES